MPSTGAQPARQQRRLCGCCFQACCSSRFEIRALDKPDDWWFEATDDFILAGRLWPHGGSNAAAHTSLGGIKLLADLLDRMFVLNGPAWLGNTSRPVHNHRSR